MCGIAGFFNLKNDPRENISRMLEAMKHRGPDGEGIWIDPTDTGVVLGHRRLAIIDLTENGSQPMISHSRRYVISYNGEIYNHRSLLEEMRRDGYADKMNGTSDTEILVEAMDFYGPVNAIKKCKGMFAIALYDRQEETLSLFRDRIGEKPLYYGYVGNGFVFASEIGQITTLKEFDGEINVDVLGIYMMHGYIPAPYSIYRNVYKLEPGTVLKIKCKLNNSTVCDPDIEEYWSLRDVAQRGQNSLFNGSEKEAADELERLLKASIKDQMIADVPLGAFLSAGIDSSTIVSLMQSLSDRPVQSFTIGFEDKEYNEADAAMQIAKHLGTKHTELYVTREDALNVIPEIPRIFGEPFADSSQIPTYLVSKLTKEHVTVSLSGDAGDELFGGYTSYAGVERIWNKISGFPQWVRTSSGYVMKHVPGFGDKGAALRVHGTLMGARNPSDLYRRTYETNPIALSLVNEDVLSESVDQRGFLPYKYTQVDERMFNDPYHAAMYMDMKMYHPDDILVKVDRCAMAVSLESRVPMLDKDVVEFAWTLPTEYLRKDGIGKQVLRNVLYRYVPRELMDRPKKGFSIPVKEWLRSGQLREWALDLLNSELIISSGVINKNAVNTLWNRLIDDNDWCVQIWHLLMLCSWYENLK